jgi:hypothetical protein
MSGITAMATTANTNNYHGELFALSPSETKFLSAIGGLTGGGLVTDYEAEWQTSDLRDPSDRQRLEGAAAQTAQGRVRANVRNVAEIHQETVKVSYTRQATSGRYTTPSSAPYASGSGAPNPVTNELDWQLVEAIKQTAMDVNYSFLLGEYNNPEDPTSTARKTRGLLPAITTNVTNKGTAFTGATTATDTVTSTAHGLSNGDQIVFTAIDAVTNIVKGRVYYVVSSSTNTFKVAATSGGSAITLGTATGVAFTKPWSTALTVPVVNAFIQGIWDNGGLGGIPVLMVGSTQKVAISAAYAAAYGQANPLVRGEKIGGVAVDMIATDFGEFGIMLERWIPADAIVAVTLDECMPFFLDIPGKGHFFTEELAKTGASEDVQLYGEIGLKYGAERHHGILRGLDV